MPAARSTSSPSRARTDFTEALSSSLRNTAFDATNYFATTNDDHKQNQFGGTIGGPIMQDKLFFFGDYQGNRMIIGQSGGTGLNPRAHGCRTRRRFFRRRRVPCRECEGSSLGTATFHHSRLRGHPGRALLLRRLQLRQLRLSGAQIPRSVHRAVQESAALRSSGKHRATDTSLPNRLPSASPTTRPADASTYNSHLGLLTGYYFFDQYRQNIPNVLLPGFGSENTGRSQVVDIGDTKTSEHRLYQ